MNRLSLQYSGGWPATLSDVIVAQTGKVIVVTTRTVSHLYE